MFFLRSKFSHEKNGQIVIDLSEPLYKLQRREYFRVKVRGLKGSVFKLEKRNSDSVELKMTLVDFSGGGIAVEVKKDSDIPMQMGDTVVGQILVPGRADETMTGEVRYMRTVKSTGSLEVYRFGIQFKNISPSQQQRVAQVVFEIHREFFSKFDSYRKQ
jgi:c-di-GMP-binding flagellar brake protein YcgR